MSFRVIDGGIKKSAFFYSRRNEDAAVCISRTQAGRLQKE
jgi:hypothetical protein